jgi:hypothetical protein
MFAEFEATETQRRAEQAPTLFDTAARGYFARIAAFEQWANDYGHFDSYRRSHAWHAQLGDPRGVSPTYTCRPVILCADLRCDCDNDDQGCSPTILARARRSWRASTSKSCCCGMTSSVA